MTRLAKLKHGCTITVLQFFLLNYEVLGILAKITKKIVHCELWVRGAISNYHGNAAQKQHSDILSYTIHEK